VPHYHYYEDIRGIYKIDVVYSPLFFSFTAQTMKNYKGSTPFLYAHKKWSIWKIPGFYNSHNGG